MNSPFGRKSASLSVILCVLCTPLPGKTRSRGQPALQSRPVHNIAGHLEVLGFTLGKSTLADVEAKLGKSAPRRCSPEEEASKELCYLVDNGQTTVVFEAGFSGGWNLLDGYKLISSRLRRLCYRQCPRASQMINDVQTGSGLKLGLTRDELIALLGPPKRIRGNKLTFEWESRQAMTKEQRNADSKTFNSPITDAYYDVQNTIEVTLTESRVVEFAVDHIVSY